MNTETSEKPLKKFVCLVEAYLIIEAVHEAQACHIASCSVRPDHVTAWEE